MSNLTDLPDDIQTEYPPTNIKDLGHLVKARHNTENIGTVLVMARPVSMIVLDNCTSLIHLLLFGVFWDPERM